MNARASKLDPHADLTAFGPAVSNLISFGLMSLIPDLPNTSDTDSSKLDKVNPIPVKGWVIVSNFGLTFVGNTRKIERKVSNDLVLVRSSLQLRHNFLKFNGIILGRPWLSLDTIIPLRYLVSGDPLRARIKRRSDSFKYENVKSQPERFTNLLIRVNSVSKSFLYRWFDVSQITTLRYLLSSLNLIHTLGCNFGRRKLVKMFIKKFVAILLICNDI